MELKQHLSVDDQLKLKPQLVGSLAAKDHPVEENLKVVHDGRHFSVDGNGQQKTFMVFGDVSKGVLDSVVDPVVDIKGGKVGITDPGTADVGLIC